MIRYYKLFDLLNRRGMKKSDLRKILSPKTVAKLSKGENISGDAIEKICLFLGCQPGDIMEVITETELYDQNTNEKAKFIKKDILDPEYDYTQIRETYIQFSDDEEEQLIDRTDWHNTDNE